MLSAAGVNGSIAVVSDGISLVTLPKLKIFRSKSSTPEPSAGLTIIAAKTHFFAIFSQFFQPLRLTRMRRAELCPDK